MAPRGGDVGDRAAIPASARLTNLLAAIPCSEPGVRNRSFIGGGACAIGGVGSCRCVGKLVTTVSEVEVVGDGAVISDCRERHVVMMLEPRREVASDGGLHGGEKSRERGAAVLEVLGGVSQKAEGRSILATREYIVYCLCWLGWLVAEAIVQLTFFLGWGWVLLCPKYSASLATRWTARKRTPTDLRKREKRICNKLKKRDLLRSFWVKELQILAMNEFK